MLQIFYHIWAHNHWREVLLEHFRILHRQQFRGRLTIGFIGQQYEEGFIQHMLEAHSLEGTIHHFGSDSQQFEFPTLRLLKTSAMQDPKHTYLYLHSKGVSRPNDWKTSNWRWYMNTFVLGQLVNLLPQLQYHDLVGAAWGNNFEIGPHFPGNFWMARGDYLNRLPEIDEQIKRGRAWLKRPKIKEHGFIGIRHAAETWVGQNKPRVYDGAHEAGAKIWDHNYWVQNPDLQRFVAVKGT